MKFFNYDSPIMQFLTRLTDLFILNFLFLICSIPIITIGASATALYSVTLKMAKNEESYIFSSFFRAFKTEPLPAKAGRFGLLLKQPKVVATLLISLFT